LRERASSVLVESYDESQCSSSATAKFGDSVLNAKLESWVSKKKGFLGEVLEESINGRANRRVGGPTGSDDLPGLGCNTRISLRLRPLASGDGFSHWIRVPALIEWPRGIASPVQNLSATSVSGRGKQDLNRPGARSWRMRSNRKPS
jgi:hypothetical protein